MRKYSVVTVVAATVGVLLVAGGALAAGHFIITNINQIRPSVRAQLRGNQGPRGFRGATGAAGFGQVTEVDGPSISLPTGSDNLNINDQVNCPAGTVVVGTGFDDGGVMTVGFVESFHSFVDGFVTNNSGITASYNWQAICAKSSSGAARDARSGPSLRQMKLAAFRSYQASH